MRDAILSPCVITVTVLLCAADTLTSASRPAATERAGAFHQVDNRASTLARGETAMHYVALASGREYHLSARCDDGCDADLQLFSPAGRELDRDISRVRPPDVSVVPSGTGRYRVDVTMRACGHDSCDYSLAVLTR